MKKVLLHPCLWGIIVLSLLSSCRTEDVANTQKQVEDKRFAVFIPKSEGEKIDYVQGFAYLYQNYFKENSIKEKDQKLVAKDFGVVDFRIHSQLFTQEDGTKAMVFPLRKENSINGLIMAILENNDTSLRYTVLEESQKGYTEILQRFLAVDRENDRPIHIPSSGKFPPGSSPVALAPPIKTHGISINDNGNGDIDREGDGGSSGPVKEIREVTITVPKVPSPPVIPPPLPQDIKLPPVGPGGGCEMYENCPPYRGGGGGSPTPDQNLKDPCSKAKAPAEKATKDYKDPAVKDAKAATQNAYNNDPADAKNEHVTMIENNNGQLSQGKTFSGGAGSVTGLATSNTVGDIHNHNDELPPSPGDVYGLMEGASSLQNYRTKFVYTQQGTEYALVVTDIEALRNFLKMYPPERRSDSNRTFTNFPGALKIQWQDISTNDGYSNVTKESSETAIAYILDQYNAGVAITKKDSNGDFKKIGAIKNTSGSGFSQSNCN